MKVNLNF